MPRSAFMKEDPRKHYWGVKRGRIDVLMDEQGNWHDSEDVHYTTFNIDGVPILLLRFTPYCPECLESTFKGFLNWEKDPTGETGIAFRCFYHFWYLGTQMWEGLPKNPIRIPAGATITSVVGSPAAVAAFNATRTAEITVEASAYSQGREAFIMGVKVWSNPFDGRTSEGKAWVRGWEAEAAVESKA